MWNGENFAQIAKLILQTELNNYFNSFKLENNQNHSKKSQTKEQSVIPLALLMLLCFILLCLLIDPFGLETINHQ